MNSVEIHAWRCRIVAGMRAHGATLAECRTVLKLTGKEEVRRLECAARRRQLLPIKL